MKRNLLLCAIVVPCVVILFSTCTKEVGKPVPAPVVVTVDSCKTDIKFATQIQPILAKYCTINNPLCHAQGTNGNFTTYAGFAAKASIAVQRVKGNPTAMPPTYSTGPQNMTACEISKIEAWVAAGALNN